jgi:hypothetical protein
MFWHCFSKRHLVAWVVNLGCSWELAGLLLRVIEVNTLEPMLKTLTPRQILSRYGFAGSEVKLCGRGGEAMQDAGVMGFGDVGEVVRDR